MLIWPPHCLVQTDRPVVSLYIVGRSLGFSAVPGSFRKLLTICVRTELAYLRPVDKWIYCEDCISLNLPSERPYLSCQGNWTLTNRRLCRIANETVVAKPASYHRAIGKIPPSTRSGGISSPQIGLSLIQRHPMSIGRFLLRCAEILCH